MNIKSTLFVFLGLVIMVFAYLFLGLSNTNAASPEIAIHNFSLFGNFKSKSIAASCGFTRTSAADVPIVGSGSGHPEEFTPCTATCPNGAQVTGRSQCGGVCTATVTCPACPNGAVNPPNCNQCPSGTTMNSSNQCVCTNGASNVPQCNVCPSGLVMVNNICECANFATNVPQCNICPSGSSMVGGICTCSNNGDPRTNCTTCRSGDVMSGGRCEPGCGMTNVCGQNVQGVMRNGQCTAPDGGNPNGSCITTFNITSGTVYPNGSVEFTWKIGDLPPNVRSRCGFVDLTTETARPIPGLQNLDPNTDRARISNIQTTTRFCLVCSFYNIVNNSILGEAAAHQWIRVIRVGEQ